MYLREWALAFVAVVVLVGCSGSGSSPAARTTPRTASVTASTAGGTTSTTAFAPPVVPATPAPTTPGLASSINPCTLLTAAGATQLAGKPLSRTIGAGFSAGTCAYSGGKVLIGAEISFKVDASAALAHSEFPEWVEPIPNHSQGFVLTPIGNLGDEASMTHTSFTDGIYFRHGALLVKIGVYPPVSAAALKTAAVRALGRL